MVDGMRSNLYEFNGIKRLDDVEPIHSYEGQILDGWNRYLACVALEARPFIVDYDGDDPVGFVIQKNAYRRHLTGSQRAACIVACREMALPGRPSENGTDSPRYTTKEVAQETGVSEKTVQRVKAAEDAGLGEKVRSGEMSPWAAAEKAKAMEAPGDDTPETEEEDEIEVPQLTKAQQRRLEIEALQMRVRDLEQKCDNQLQEIIFWEEQKSPEESARLAQLQNLQEQNRVLEHQMWEWQEKYKEERSRANLLARKLKAFEAE